MLNYLKSNSLQQRQAASFGVSQTRDSCLATRLLAVLNHVLARRGLLPVRDGAALAQHLVAHPTSVLPMTESSTAFPAMPTATGRRMNTALKKSARREKHDLMR